MDIQWNSAYIDLEKLIQLSRGEKDRIVKYMNQFQKLIPERMIKLKDAAHSEERDQMRKQLHKMGPQLQFFGIPNATQVVHQLENEIQTLDIEELKSMINNLMLNVNNAMNEVDRIIQVYFQGQS
jgi:HPt (histidine-containing phosphotransfer) domain-containing protein